MCMGLWSKRRVIFFNIAYTWTTFSKLYLGYDIFIFYHGLCAWGYGVKDGVGIGSTFGVVLDHLPNIVNNKLAKGSGYYGIDLTESKVTPMGAFTLKCIELQKDNINASLVTKFYTCNMDTMVATICMMCNINKSKIVLHVCNIIFTQFTILFWIYRWVISFQNYIQKP